MTRPPLDPIRDLVLERFVEVRRELVWKAWTTPEQHGSGTKYTAIAMHANEAGKSRHAEMGCHEGWGAAFDQLVALVGDVR